MLPALALGLGAFLANFDVTAAVVALPAIARDLDLGIAGYAWMMDAYSLAFAGSLLVAGALADRQGRRKVMLRGNVVFAVASLACGLAWDGLSLGLARAIQGIGAAFVVTGGIALMASTYSEATSRTRAFSWLGVTSGTAMALGPSVGGVVSSWFGWRWIFLSNIPVCALVAWSIPRLVAEAHESSPRPLDYVGMALLTAALCVLVEALLYARAATIHLLVGLVLGVLLLALFVIRQKQRSRPIFDPVVFMTPAMVGIALLLGAVSVGYWAVLVYLPLFLAAAFGWTSDASGIAMLAATLPMLLVPPIGGKIVDRLGWQLHFAVALAVIAVGNAALVLALVADGARPPAGIVILGMVVVGCGAALAHPQLSGAVIALVPAEQAGMASAVTVVMRQAGFAVGIAALGALLSSSDRAIAYIWLFSGAAGACVLGALAAMMLLRPKPIRTDRQ
jgi:MFS family permease